MPRSHAAAALAIAALACGTLAACGGDSRPYDEVPASTPALVPPGDADNAGGTITTPTTPTTTTPTDTGVDTGGTSGTDTGGDTGGGTGGGGTGGDTGGGGTGGGGGGDTPNNGGVTPN